MIQNSRKFTALGTMIGALCLLGVCVSQANAQSLFGDPTPTTAPAAAAAAAAGDAAVAAGSAAAKTVKKVVAKPKKKVAARDASKININNKRGATLVELTVTSKANANANPQLIAAGLLSGKKKTSNLAKKGGCLYDVSGTFDDESTIEVAGMDLCKDTTINLVE